ncbi:MAG TPA: hypothetical protein VMS12_04805 [Thermoanaerobaculia bacterium]|nr:hypothetical protein [Thermoanaerobaculia bacterium]
MIRAGKTGLIAVLAAFAFIGTLCAAPLSEGVVIGWNRHDGQTIVARGGSNPTIRAFGDAGRKLLWSISGPAEPSTLVLSEDGSRAVILDTLHDQAFVVSTQDGSTERLTTAPGPVAALFRGNHLFILCRDGRELQRISRSGAVDSLELAPDTTFLEAGSRHLYLYSRIEGTVSEVDPQSLAVVRFRSFAGAASDFEIDDHYGYLTLPSSGSVLVFSLEEMRERERLAIGAVPMDLSVASDAGMLDAGALAIADPSSKRVWMSERSQSGAAAFGRGFLRGFIGLGLFAPKSSEYPTGVDRVWAASWGLAAYDSSTGTLYLVARGRASRVASGIPPGAIALTREGAAFWNLKTDGVEFVKVRR